MTEARDPFNLGFSSMGEPELDWPPLISLAQEFSMDFLELRTMAGKTQLPEYFASHPEHLADKRIPVQVVLTDLWLAGAKQADIARFLQFAQLADTLGAPYVRVFGGGDAGMPLDSVVLDQAAETVRRCREEMNASGIRCEILLETHSGFSSSTDCQRLSEQLDNPLFILWDAHHTWKLAGESPEESWQIIGPLVRHVHYKDSRSTPGGEHAYSYILPGEGEFPSNQLFRLLRDEEYSGGLSLEWERLWHPSLPPLREALAAFGNQLRG